MIRRARLPGKRESSSTPTRASMTEIDLSRNVHLEAAMSRANGLLVGGEKVKLTLRFRGREWADTKPGYDRVESVLLRLSSLGKPDGEPKLIGRSLRVVVAPVAD